MRTVIEAMKMEVTQSIVWVALGTFAALVLLDYFTPVKERERGEKQMQGEYIPGLF